AAVADSNMAQHYYAQNLASFASGFMPMYGMGMLPPPPPSFLGQSMAAPPPQQMRPMQHMQLQHRRPPPPQPPQIQPILNVYDLDAAALQNRMSTQFVQHPPEQQSACYEDIRQQLHAAAEGLNEEQKVALLHMDPSLSLSMQPLEQLNANTNFDDSAPTSSMTTPSQGGSLKRPRSASDAAGGATKKKKKSKASSCATPPAEGSLVMDGDASMINEESPGGSSSEVTPRPTPRGRPPKISAARAAAAAEGVEFTKSGKKKSMTPQAEEMRARKAKMTWPKGTFLIRLQDVKVRDGRDHIWLVDNHQLLQRYNNESGSVRVDGSRVYNKTDRYTGWLCHEGHHYFPLYEEKHVLRQDADTVTVLFPDEDDLQQAIEYGEQEKARLDALRDANAPISRPLPPSLRDQAARHALRLQQEQEQHELELLQQESHAHSTPSEMSMTSAMGMMTTSAMRSSILMKMEEEGGGRLMGRRAHPVRSVSSSSMIAGAVDFPSSSRGMMKHEMPSLPRQVYWNEEDEGMMLLDEDILDDRVIKREEVEYEELLDDMAYPRRR
ncbi:hypothetical protein PMAYCL1PPCAC_25309, partial [Pristionchus mayeri]